jgi:AraC-like DNA-binding protein
VWVQQVAPDAPPHTHRTVPHGSIELSVEIGGLPTVIGPQTRPRVETLDSGATVVGVRFRHGLAPSVLGVPASELVDLSVAWEELTGRSAGALGEAIATAASPDDAARVLERAVLELRSRGAVADPIVTEAVRRLHPWVAHDVASITSSLYISERQLRRRTVAGVGLAPKTLQRMLRFQGFLALAHDTAADGADLATLAADTGYADQSHLTHECLRLSGITPRALLREAEENCAGIHDHAASRVPLLRVRASSRSA